MSTRDTTSNTHTKISRGRNLLSFHINNRILPLEGPRGNTLSSTYTDMLMGIGPVPEEDIANIEANPVDPEDPDDPVIDPDEPHPEPPPIIPSSAEGVYVTGSFNSNTLTIYNSNDSIALTIPRVSVLGNTYIVKYNRSGIVQWATRNEGLNTRGEGIATDYEGNVYVISSNGASNTFKVYNQGFTAIGQQPAITLPITSSTQALILVKYNIDGVAQWATKIEGSGSSRNLLFLDKEKNIYIVGAYPSNITFYDAPTLSSSIPPINNLSDGNTKTYIVKYNSSGIAQWATNIKDDENNPYIPPFGSRLTIPTGISTDNNGDVYVTGYYNINIEFNNNPGNIPSTPPTITVPLGNFVVKYNSTGNFIWKTKITGPPQISIDRLQGSSITDTVGNIYITGYYNGDVLNIYNSDDTISTPPLLTTGEYNMYLIKYNKNGFVKWTNRVLGVIPSSIRFDLNFNLYIIGRCIISSGSIVLFNPDTSINKVVSVTDGDKLLIKYNTSGIPQWIAIIRNVNFFYSCSTDFLGNIYISCALGAPQFFDKDATTPTISLPSYNGAFLVKYNTDGYIQFASRLGAVMTAAVGYSVSSL
jgi:hypothetical protein